MSAAEEQARINRDLSGHGASLKVGLCLSVDDGTGTARISVGGAVVEMRMSRRPTVGLNADVLLASGDWLCLGPVYRPPFGTVTTEPDLGKVGIVTDDDRPHTIPYSTVLDLDVGDRVVIDWETELVVAEPASEGTTVSEPPAPSGGTVEREIAFFPTGSGSYGSSWFTDRVYSSDSNTGVYLYDGIAATIPDDAEILSVGLFVNAQQTSGGDPTVGLHSMSSLTGPPTVTDAVTVPGGTGWKVLPTSFGDALKTGAKLGVGTNTGGYHIFAPANNVNSGTLTIRFRTTG